MFDVVCRSDERCICRGTKLFFLFGAGADVRGRRTRRKSGRLRDSFGLLRCILIGH